jgi:hypothetical protein
VSFGWMDRENRDEFEDFGLFCWLSVILNCTVVNFIYNYSLKD